ncbi:hypothetical protein ASPWEDRAFT_173034 [Aspergillus wentii DTO 134E9]|uniref:Zn(2)-C6 fungal-type domain-containing protein n=1 Tax=Aspergillus wentii DTO 134E9 TaxID=1073089 RepID=A0A1L9RMR9_ASPWE|nr:uncharacterized protein ASPWEDRAFT_173034 [Aspergillus wentii DTO 134E9]KAI9929313.1 hypothetical protein MW887_000780 [Aspergillus wentii]OJJ36250.1 hypothetical protein ASPWEDRAFT_173034 [Aspergillus wentii DTO 134E9]
MRLPGPACATCREKCRRCDRGRPECQRCVSKGLPCGGYPDKYQFCGPTRKKRKERPSTDGPAARTRRGRVSQVDSDIPEQTVDNIPTRPEEISNNNGNIQPPTPHTARSPSEIEQVLMLEETEMLLSYYDKRICPFQIALADKMDNPYRTYILPLANKQIQLLYAVLGLSACHLGQFKSDEHLRETVAVGYRVKAIRGLGEAIKKGSSGVPTEDERDAIFVTIQILLLQDICETGISTHGVHITGAVSICNQLMLGESLTRDHERTVFFLGNLAWLDIIRGFAGPERLCFSPELRETIVSLTDMKFERVNGCPKEIFLIIGRALDHAKAHAAGEIETEQYKQVLYTARRDLLSWNQNSCIYPDEDPRWRSVADAFRHACILRISRLLDVSQPAEALEIQNSVTAILDAVANIEKDHPLIHLVILPLFMAGADSLSPHSRHYTILRIDEVKVASEFCNPVPKDLLKNVWDARASQSKGDHSNIPWMLFTHNPALERQHDYLII